MQHALAALHLFRRDVQYIVADGKVQIVDEYTGRVMPDRSWESGIHQLIEAKEHCAITRAAQDACTNHLPAVLSALSASLRHDRNGNRAGGRTVRASTACASCASPRTDRCGEQIRARAYFPTAEPNGTPWSNRFTPQRVRRPRRADRHPLSRSFRAYLAIARQGRASNPWFSTRDRIAQEAEIVARAGSTGPRHGRNQHGRPRHRHPVAPGGARARAACMSS